MGILDIAIVKGYIRMCNDGWLLFVKQKDYGPMPKSGKQITLDKKRIYNIKSCSLKAGMYRMELERVR